MGSVSQGPVGNYYDKFSSQNPIARRLMAGFMSSFESLFAQTSGDAVLEIGCGEGQMLRVMQAQRDLQLTAFDVDIPLLMDAKRNVPNVQYAMVDGHAMAYSKNAFDVVIACEVLEHVFDPAKVLEEAARVTTQFAIFSVPREPIWRVLNVARGKYLADLGNTPGHIQHWSSQQFVELVGAYFEVIQVNQPLPWTMVLCKVR